MNYQEKIIRKIELLLKIRIKKVYMPVQGMDNIVCILIDEKDDEFVVKYGVNVVNDILAFKLINKGSHNIPIPKLFTSFAMGNQIIAVMEKINLPLLEKIPHRKQHLVIPSMIDNLQKIHKINSTFSGLLNDQNNSKSWKEILLDKYSGKHSWYDWNKIVYRKNVDMNLVSKSINLLVNKIKSLTLPEKRYSLLHTDFNQTNLFIDPMTYKIVSIIDWSEAMFGDPLYDFARVRMYIIHFNLGEKVLNKYYKLLNLTVKEKEREEIYFLSQTIDYIAWYSESENSFNNARLKLHQQILKKFVN